MHTQAFDVIVRGGEVIDGSKRPRYRADVGLRGAVIAAVGDLSAATAHRVIDARGKVVAPGFIDAHSHDDQALLLQPQMPFKLSQGVTAVVTGNCGISAAPLHPDTPVPAPLNLLSDASTRFPSFAAYVQALRAAPPAVHVIPLVGHSTLRVEAMADVNRAANPDEIAQMQVLLREALEAGAVGLSSGTYYPPAAAASTQELCRVAQPLAEYGALYVSHLRNEGAHSQEAIDETLQIGLFARTAVVISHHKLQGFDNWGQSVQTLPQVAAAMQHQCVSLDCYPYHASSTILHLDEERLAGKIVIADSKPHPELQGQELGDIARRWQVSRAEASARLQPASAIYFNMDESDVRRILAFGPTMIGSDGVPSNERPHPRLWGTFPRVLGHYSRELGLFPLETAVWKMTGLTAQVFGIEKRGVLAEGHYADLCIFDPQTVRDTATFDDPKQPAAGIDCVIVNGAIAYEQGVYLGSRTGTVLRRTVPATSSPGWQVPPEP
ncbi:N-acyl-D-amino-acid deacylase family protein [Comamonas koreensis]|uniref:D-aminoacylase n=1 Tax=Comamonas koreensis TaxID=160825 RepID=A0AAW4Y1W5_9BURK|nr:D-aminoacylase [Comamonas koreensis]MCD2167370.1 D-aminoacylase [Comamonas koreensis]